MKFKISYLGYPALMWFVVFFLTPLLLVFATSFAHRGTYGGVEWIFTFENLVQIFKSAFFKIFIESLALAVVTTLLCLLIGFPMAWAMVTMRPSLRNFILILVALPFLMNLIIRVYALRVFFGYDGPAVLTSQFLGIAVDPFSFSQNIYLVLYGMVTCYLPFMLFPLYAGLEKFNFEWIEASYDLGCKPFRAVWSVVIPNSLQAILAGCVLVFIPALGEFVIPDLLGGAKNMLVGNLITEQFLKSRNWPLGSALSLALSFVIFTLLLLSYSLERKVRARKRPTQGSFVG